MKDFVLFGLVLTAFHQSFSHGLSDDASKSLTTSTNAPLPASTNASTDGNGNKYIFTRSKPGHECLTELQLNENLIKDAFQNYYKILEGNKQVNEFMACVWKKYGYLDEDGATNQDGISAYVNYLSLHNHQLEDIDKRAEEIAKDCGQGAYEKDSAVKMYNCIINHAYGDRNEPENPFIIYMGEECSTDLDETIIKLINSSLRFPEGNDRLNKYIDCVAKVYRYLRKDGKVIPDQVAILVDYILRSSRGIDNPAWIFDQIWQNCKAAQTSDPGETAVKSNNCVIDYLTSHDRIKIPSRAS